MKGLKRYYGQKIIWYLVTLVFAIILNFALPRCMPGNPVAGLVGKAASGMTDASATEKIQQEYTEKFGLDKSMPEQFFKWAGAAIKGDFGVSFKEYPKPVSEIISESIGWTIALQLPAILVGWFLGNLLGAVAAYMKGVFDKVILPVFLFMSNIPAFGMATILLFVFAIKLGWFPASKAYGYDLIPNMSWTFIGSVIHHYWLPFLSVVLVTIGGQAIGMRSMSIYELNADYVKYSRFLGIKDRKIVGYVFKNAMLPQITGLAMSIGTMMGGALVAEIIFSYPGIGSALLAAITGQDYPVISACTLIITIMVLLANLFVEIIYGLIDPRIKAAQQD
ncbi:MAG: ABC transporter permease [bacterium]|nr:ABC transporter permease [bacterium]